MGPPEEIEGGGHEREEETEEGMVSAPEPPVAEAARGPLKTEVAPQAPTASRGSVGIQPFSRPSW